MASASTSAFVGPRLSVAARCRRGRRRRRRTSPRASSTADAPPRRVVSLAAEELTPESFAPFGQIVKAEEDGAVFGPDDAQLDLSRGTPRFYIMRLRDKDLRFDRITFHGKVRQCLGALGTNRAWYMAVGEPTLDVRAHPTEDTLRVFEVPPGVFVKMHVGTWHAGPLFRCDDDVGTHIDFYNLELADTNVVDHNTHDYATADGIEFEVVQR